MVLVEVGLEVGAATGFVEAGCAYDDEFLTLAEALRVDGGLAADHADSGELGDVVGDGHQRGDGAEGLGVEGGVEARHDYAFAEVDEFDNEGDDGVVEELGLVDADYVYLFKQGEEGFAEAFDVGYGAGLVGLVAVAGDGGAVVAEVDVGLEADDTLAGDAGALEAAEVMTSRRPGVGLVMGSLAILNGCGGGYFVRNFLLWRNGVFAGGFAENWL